MVYRDRQGLSSSAADPNQLSKNRDRYLDNCFLLCLNRDNANVDVPEVHRLESHLMRELCQKSPVNSSKSQQQQQRRPDFDGYEFDEEEEDLIMSRQNNGRDNISRRRDDPSERDSRFRYQNDEDDLENSYQYDPYSRSMKFNRRDNYNIMQHGDDELSVYEIYVPTNTLNRLSDKRIDKNMVLVDYEDVSALRDMGGAVSAYGYPTRNISPQYTSYPPVNQYSNYAPPYQYDMPANFPKEREDQRQFYPNQSVPPPPPQQQQRFPDYYGYENNRAPYPQSQAGSYYLNNVPIDHSNTINVRRHLYSPSQLPQGLTEGQLVMLLQKGSQYQPMKSSQPTQSFPSQNEQIFTGSAVTVTHQPVSHPEPFKNPEYAASIPPIKNSQVPPKIIDHELVDDDRSAIDGEISKPINTRNSVKLSKDIEIKDDDEKKKERSSDVKKEKKAEKDAGDSSKKEGKKEKSSGKDGKKKKK